uniref:Tumor necrosis factor receptor superfamily member 6 n=1 Tax=Malurus cyaneus samueli TaxID=2593467 RepID=A0A8C5U9Q0_9PASS
NCNEDEYHLDAQCCKKCKSGEYDCFVKNIICPTDIIKHCVPCEKGKEFMDHLNDLDECHRCKSCDGTLGLEVVKNCTPAEDTKCACAKNYFCSSVAFYAFITTYEIANMTNINSEYADLSSHIAGIVTEMTLSQVKTFVRHHHVPEPAIDQIIQDCLGDTSEQKIKLFRDWYQRHGMKGAYGTLISSLRELNMRAVADKIEEKLKAAVSHSQEGGLNNYNFCSKIFALKKF